MLFWTGRESMDAAAAFESAGARNARRHGHQGPEEDTGPQMVKLIRWVGARVPGAASRDAATDDPYVLAVTARRSMSFG